MTEKQVETLNLASVNYEIEIKTEAENNRKEQSKKELAKNKEQTEIGIEQRHNRTEEGLEWNHIKRQSRRASSYFLKINKFILSRKTKMKRHIHKMKKKVNTFFFFYVISTLLHFLIYINRGIVPGSYNFLSVYLGEYLGLKNIDVHIGILTSIFILGLSISSILSGSLAASYGVFRITSIFLFQNALALWLTGMSFFYSSYFFLVFCRFFNGFSEAAFINCIPTLIYYYSKDKAGAWISIFFTMFPLGGCIGYVLAVLLQFMHLTLPQYFVIMSVVFLILFFIFILFDEEMLKKYEHRKEINKEKKKTKEFNMIADKENKNKDIKQMKEIEQIKQMQEISTAQKKTNIKITEDSKMKHDGKSSKKCKSLCGKKESNLKKKKHKPQISKQNSDKTNSIETECVDIDDFVSAENERESNQNKRNLQTSKKLQSKTYETSKSFREEMETKTHTQQQQQHMELGLESKETKERTTKKQLKETAKTENKTECVCQYGSDIINDMEMENKKSHDDLKKLGYEKNLGKSNFQEKNVGKESYEWYDKKNRLETDVDEKKISKRQITSLNTMGTDNSLQNAEICGASQINEKPSIRDFLYVTLCNPCFVWVTIILTAYSIIIQNNLVYGTPIVYALKIYATYEAANITCSLCACVSSVIGTCLGGYMVDRYDLNIQKIDKKYEHKTNVSKIKLYEKDINVYKYQKISGLLCFVILAVASVFFIVQPFVHSTSVFTTILAVGFTLFFATQSATHLTVMLCVPDNFRPFALGISTFITHVFGDVPWTVIVGKIKSILAPDCCISKDGLLSPECDEQKDGLTWTLFIINSKILIMIVGSIAVYLYAHKKIKKLRNEEQQLKINC